MARKGHSNPNSGENTTPYPHFDTGSLREEANKLAHTDTKHEKAHESQYHELDNSEGAIKGGR